MKIEIIEYPKEFFEEKTTQLVLFLNLRLSELYLDSGPQESRTH